VDDALPFVKYKYYNADTENYKEEDISQAAAGKDEQVCQGEEVDSHPSRSPRLTPCFNARPNYS